MMTREEKYQKIMGCLDKWLSNHEKEKWIADYLNTYRFQRIGIYGYGILGKHLVRELQKQDFPIKWVMDRSSAGDDNYSGLVRPDDADKLEDVDMAVITAITDVEDVEHFLMGFVTGKIISVEELIDSIYVWGNQN